LRIYVGGIDDDSWRNYAVCFEAHGTDLLVRQEIASLAASF